MRHDSAYLLILEKILLHDGNASEDLGMLIAPIIVEVLDAHARFAVDQGHHADTVSTFLCVARSSSCRRWW